MQKKLIEKVNNVMGCVQSQPSHPSKHHSSSNSPRHAQSTPRRRSQEFYHQYQPATLKQNHPHNHNQKINHSASSNYSSAVISSNEGPRQRVQSKPHNRVSYIMWTFSGNNKVFLIFSYQCLIECYM